MEPSSDDTLSAASAAAERGDLALAVALLRPLAANHEAPAMLLLGTFLSQREESRAEALSLLESAADAGCGHSAHNLATLLHLRGDHARAVLFYARSEALGFEASVADDPGWWRRR